MDGMVARFTFVLLNFRKTTGDVIGFVPGYPPAALLPYMHQKCADLKVCNIQHRLNVPMVVQEHDS